MPWRNDNLGSFLWSRATLHLITGAGAPSGLHCIWIAASHSCNRKHGPSIFGCAYMRYCASSFAKWRILTHSPIRYPNQHTTGFSRKYNIFPGLIIAFVGIYRSLLESARASERALMVSNYSKIFKLRSKTEREGPRPSQFQRASAKICAVCKTRQRAPRHCCRINTLGRLYGVRIDIDSPQRLGRRRAMARNRPDIATALAQAGR